MTAPPARSRGTAGAPDEGMAHDPNGSRNTLAKAEHESAVDRALSALETAAGSRRVRSQLPDSTSGVALEDLAEALRRFRGRPPT